VVSAGGKSVGHIGRQLVLASTVSLLNMSFVVGAYAKGEPPDSRTITLAEMPLQARQTHELILRGGPFPYDKDGTVFGNRERLLPKQSRGYYREYTVKTPGAKNRGARRIVCGGRQPEKPESCYYTADHYASFSRIVQ
jgi:ribonuclease T1